MHLECDGGIRRVKDINKLRDKLHVFKLGES